jgi:hemerythrin-like domain-containing protein
MGHGSEVGMKRRPELRDLSEQHHHGLVAARRLRRAVEANELLNEGVALFLQAWRFEIQPHFRAEEEVLLPAFARVVSVGHKEIARTLKEHVALRSAVRDLERATGEWREDLAWAIAVALEAHIRYEERVLFPAIEAAIEETDLAELGHELKLDAASAHSALAAA